MKDNKKVDIIQEVYTTLKSIMDHLEQKDPQKAWLVEPYFKYFERAYQGMMQRKPVLWYLLSVPTEIFRSMDLVFVSPEIIGATMAGFPDRPALKYFDIAASHVSEQYCAINRFPAGLARTL